MGDSVENAGGRFLGHSANADGAGVPELLGDHLRRVPELAQHFAKAFGAEEQARAAGCLPFQATGIPCRTPLYCGESGVLSTGY